MPETPYETWTATRCDDGEWMVHTEGDVIVVGHELTEKNARLIAAAPEMLATLNAALAAHDYEGREGWVADARAIVAKAEGQS